MTKHIERLMSRTSVAAMAAFAPKPEPVSTLPAFAERVEDTPAAGGDRERPDPIDGLTAEEQAQLDAMNPGEAGEGSVDHSADDAGAVDPGVADGDDDDGPADGDGAAPAAADGQPRAKPKTISYGRHERDVARIQKERDDLQSQLDTARGETKKEREERLRLDECATMLLQAIQAPKPAAAAAPVADADPEPNLDEDPIGHALWDNRQIRKELNEIKSGRAKDQEQTAEQRAQREAFDAEEQVLEASTQEISTAAVEKPEIADAFVHYRESRYTELGYALAGIDINDTAQCATLAPQVRQQLSQQIQSHFRTDCLRIAQGARERGRPVVGEVINYARARGWVPAVNGAAPAPRAPAAPSVKDQLSAVRDNLEASRSLSDAGGSPGDQMTPQRLGEMSTREFEQYYDALKESGKLDELMGRPANM